MSAGKISQYLAFASLVACIILVTPRNTMLSAQDVRTNVFIICTARNINGYCNPDTNGYYSASNGQSFYNTQTTITYDCPQGNVSNCGICAANIISFGNTANGPWTQQQQSTAQSGPNPCDGEGYSPFFNYSFGPLVAAQTAPFWQLNFGVQGFAGDGSCPSATAQGNQYVLYGTVVVSCE